MFISAFMFIPDATRDYTVQTVGPAVVKLVLFEARYDEPSYLIAADGFASTDDTRLRKKLVSGRDYILRARTY
jgi:hypothetical protein